MGVFTYTAKREMEEISFLVSSAIDVAASGNNTFKSTSTDLSGLVAGNFVYVTGYATTVNNGWFEISSSSNVSTIFVSAVTSLISEAAGSSVVINMQGYERGDGRSYSIEEDFDVLNYSENTRRRENVSLGGTSEVLFQHTAKYYDVRTDWIEKDGTFKQWKEFMNSIAGGEVFVFDPFGTVAVSDEPVNAIIQGDPTYARIETTDYLQVSFRIKLI